MAGQSQLDLNRLVFIDESGAKTNMTRLYGRAEIGSRVVDLAPQGHWCTTTMISSIRLDGSTACMAVDGSTTGEVFCAYAEHVLIGQAGAEVRFLPPYSPDLNPIEKMWSKIKQILRSIKARTQEALLAAINFALECVCQEDAVGWFASCGYTLN